MYVDISLYLQQKLAFKTQFAAQITARIQNLPTAELLLRVRLAQAQPIGVFPGSAPSQSARWSQTYGQADAELRKDFRIRDFWV
jgi:hypothetical protein